MTTNALRCRPLWTAVRPTFGLFVVMADHFFLCSGAQLPPLFMRHRGTVEPASRISHESAPPSSAQDGAWIHATLELTMQSLEAEVCESTNVTLTAIAFRRGEKKRGRESGAAVPRVPGSLRSCVPGSCTLRALSLFTHEPHTSLYRI